MADSATIRSLSLCSGVGWLDEGLRAGCDYLGWTHRCVGYCERDGYAASVPLARMADAALERAPVWCGDLADLDSRSLRGWANAVVAGFPCQPWSAAGKQQGTADERWLWPAIVRIIVDVEPGIVFLENVPGLISGGGIEHVLSDLAALGFDAEWVTVSAAEVGAAHKRERVFILAYRQGERWGHVQRRSESEQSRSDQRIDGNGEAMAIPPIRGQRELRQSPECDGQLDGSNGILGDTEHGEARNRGTDGEESTQSGKRRRLRGPVESGGVLGDSERNGRRIDEPRRRQNRGSVAGRTGANLEHAPGQRAQISEGISGGTSKGLQQFDGRDWPIFAPGPSDGRWPDILAAEPYRAPAIKPGFRVLVDGQPVVVDASRADQLRCGGNGVVALQAAVAFVELVRRVDSTRPANAAEKGE